MRFMLLLLLLLLLLGCCICTGGILCLLLSAQPLSVFVIFELARRHIVQHLVCSYGDPRGWSVVEANQPRQALGPQLAVGGDALGQKHAADDVCG